MQDKQSPQLQVVSIQMKFYGNLTGLAAEEAGTTKVAQEPGIEAPSSMNTLRSQGSMNGLTGEYKSSSRKQFHHYGRRNWKSNICMMRRLLSESSAKLLVMWVLKE